MGCSIGKQRRDSGGGLELLLQAVSNRMALPSLGVGTSVSWHSLGDEGRGQSVVVNTGVCSCSFSLR